MANQRYYIMRKDEIVTSALFDSDGKVLGFSNNLNDSQREIAPPANYANERGWLIEWWNDRAVPLTRDGILDFLKKEGIQRSYGIPIQKPRTKLDGLLLDQTDGLGSDVGESQLFYYRATLRKPGRS